MKSVTIEQVIAWEPCGINGDDDGVNYTPQRLVRLFDGRTSLTARDIAALEIQRSDIIWALLHNEFLTDEKMHLLACDIAETVVHLCGDDERPQAAIDAKRAWIRGEISDDDLAAALAAAWDSSARVAAYAARAAASAAAWDAASAAARDSASVAAYAASAAASVAARDAAYAARDAAYAARDAHIRRIIEVIDGS